MRVKRCGKGCAEGQGFAAILQLLKNTDQLEKHVQISIESQSLELLRTYDVPLQVNRLLMRVKRGAKACKEVVTLGLRGCGTGARTHHLPP